MSTAIGRAAEDAAANFLHQYGYDILMQNWRTRWCEIDIVAAQSGIIYFVEAKYRANAAWGSGLEYITARKLQQMQFAAAFWMAKNKGPRDFRLSAIELTGQPPRVTQWLPSIDM